MNTYNMRLQLKHDTEENWLLVEKTFKPKEGEMIIYLPSSRNAYCRAKIGDGTTTLENLDFIDAGTINGHEVEIVKASGTSNFPLHGSSDKLYVDTSTNRIYHYNGMNGYVQLSNFSFSASETEVSKISNWNAGSMTTITFENNTLKIINGTAPSLTHGAVTVLNGINTVAANAQG